jgi:hypothetical protein
MDRDPDDIDPEDAFDPEQAWEDAQIEAQIDAAEEGDPEQEWIDAQEDAAIQRGIDADDDPDMREMTTAEIKAMRPARDVVPELLKGRLTKREGVDA